MDNFWKRKFLLVSLISLPFLLFNCSASGALVVEKKPEISFITHSAIQIKSESMDTTDGLGIINQIQSNVIMKLKDRVKAEIFNEDNPINKKIKDFIKLNIKLTSFKSVTRSERALIGALAGRAMVNIEGELTDTKAKNTISKFKVEEISSGGSIFAGTIDDVIEAASNRIVEFILENSK